MIQCPKKKKIVDDWDRKVGNRSRSGNKKLNTIKIKYLKFCYLVKDMVINTNLEHRVDPVGCIL